jgi:hypothetical protein
VTADTDDPIAALDAARGCIEAFEREREMRGRIYMRPEVYAAIIGKAGGQRRARPCKLARRCAARGRGGRWS